jgi:MFS family permease
MDKEAKKCNENNITSNEKKIAVKPNKADIDDQNYSTTISLSRKMRWTVFIILIMVTILMDLDQGILSSTTTTLMEDFKMTERELGGLGSMIFLGTAMGCVCSFTLINKFNRKYLLLGTMCFDALSLFFITQTTNLLILYFCRVIAGFSQSFLAIYTPVWSDQLGIHKYKSIMLSIIHLSSSLGYLFGYVLGIVMGWENSFYLDNILLIIHIAIIFMFLPDKYFSMNLMPLKAKLEINNKEENQEKKHNEKEEKLIKQIEDIDINIVVDDNEEQKEKLNKEKENNENEENGEKSEEEDDNSSLFEDIQKIDQDISKESIISHLKILIKNPIFILMNTTLASTFIIVSAIQFWINDYLEFGLLIEDEKERLYYFAAIVITSPTAGIILGGILSGKVGGYDSEKAIYIPLVTSFFVCVIANIVPLTTNLFIFVPFFWIYLFLGSVLLPVTSGIILVSVDKKYAGSANAVSALIYNILGRLPGPNLYAFYKSLVNDRNSRIPFWLLLNTAIFGFLAVLICIKFHKQKYRKLEEEKLIEKEEKEENNEKCGSKNNNETNDGDETNEESKDNKNDENNKANDDDENKKANDDNENTNEKDIEDNENNNEENEKSKNTADKDDVIEIEENNKNLVTDKN